MANRRKYIGGLGFVYKHTDRHLAVYTFAKFTNLIGLRRLTVHFDEAKWADYKVAEATDELGKYKGIIALCDALSLLPTLQKLRLEGDCEELAGHVASYLAERGRALKADGTGELSKCEVTWAK